MPGQSHREHPGAPPGTQGPANQPITMLRFLRDNWLWIALPFVFVLVGVSALILTTDAGEGGSTFIYNIF